jgi:hypothetical protein
MGRQSTVKADGSLYPRSMILKMVPVPATMDERPKHNSPSIHKSIIIGEVRQYKFALIVMARNCYYTQSSRLLVCYIYFHGIKISSNNKKRIYLTCRQNTNEEIKRHYRFYSKILSNVIREAKTIYNNNKY